MKAFQIKYQFSNKTVLITGGCDGIGFVTAKMFAESGASVILLDKNSRVKLVADSLAKETGAKTLGLEVDVTDLQALKKAKVECLKVFSTIDIVVNNAGIAVLDKAENLSEDDWNKTINVNLSAVFFVTQTFVSEMIEKKKGKVINIASQAGVIALDKHVAYCVSKAGVISMTKVMALEWGKYNINVNAISPTIVLTELGQKVWSGKIGEDMKKQIPIKKFAEPEEVAVTVLYLASDASDMIHGENVLIDGGYSIQ